MNKRPKREEYNPDSQWNKACNAWEPFFNNIINRICNTFESHGSKIHFEDAIRMVRKISGTMKEQA